jgi:chorismate dehydratase
MSRLRISAISYLNTAPLMWDFERSDVGRRFDVSYTLPSACARSLQAGASDIGIIPAAAYTEIAGLAILPEVAIASRRSVRSILLVSNLPMEKIRTVALDNSSMTSVALTKVLFEKWLGGPRSYRSTPPDIERMLAMNDAALVIGDPALQIDRSRYPTALDLAEEWIRFTGKPFVFAFWAVRQAVLVENELGEDEFCGDNRPHLSASRSDAPDLATTFQQSRDHGLEPASLDLIARQWAPRLGIAQAEVRSYLSENIHYHLDEACIEGLRLFYRYAAEIGALPTAPALNFLASAKPCIA